MFNFNIFNIFSYKYGRFSIFGRSTTWPYVRNEHLKKFPRCAACGSEKRLEVHHIKPFHQNPELELDPDNLITLCKKSCHLYFGHLKSFKSWNVDVVADSAAYYEKIKSRP